MLFAFRSGQEGNVVGDQCSLIEGQFDLGEFLHRSCLKVRVVSRERRTAGSQLSRSTTNPGTQSSTRLISESGKVQMAWRALLLNSAARA